MFHSSRNHSKKLKGTLWLRGKPQTSLFALELFIPHVFWEWEKEGWAALGNAYPILENATRAPGHPPQLRVC